MPIGELGWKWYTGNRDDPEASGGRLTGLTQRGEFVIMHFPQDWCGRHYEGGHKLYDGQEEEIERLLKKLLEHY